MLLGTFFKKLWRRKKRGEIWAIFGSFLDHSVATVNCLGYWWAILKIAQKFCAIFCSISGNLPNLGAVIVDCSGPRSQLLGVVQQCCSYQLTTPGWPGRSIPGWGYSRIIKLQDSFAAHLHNFQHLKRYIFIWFSNSPWFSLSKTDPESCSR